MEEFFTSEQVERKKELKDLIDKVKANSGLNRKAIAERLKMKSETYISNLVSTKPSGKPVDVYHIQDFKKEFEKELKGEEEKTYTNKRWELKMNPKFEPIPVHDIDIPAGTREMANDKSETPIDFYYIPEFSGTRAFNVYSDSMEPLIPKGSRIFAKKLDYWQDYLELGQVYSVGMIGGERYLKYIKDESETHFILSSENSQYKDFKVPKKLIRSIWVIDGWMNKHTQNTFFILKEGNGK